MWKILYMRGMKKMDIGDKFLVMCGYIATFTAGGLIFSAMIGNGFKVYTGVLVICLIVIVVAMSATAIVYTQEKKENE